MSRLEIVIWSGVVVVGASAPSLPGQQPGGPVGESGRQVRIHYDCVDSVCHRVVGRLVAVTADAVVLEVGAGGRTVVPRPQVDRVEIRKRGAGGLAKGALIGLGIGGVVGVAGGAAVAASLDCEYDLGRGCGQLMAETGLAGAGAGLVLGAIIGGATGGSTWARVAIDSLARAGSEAGGAR